MTDLDWPGLAEELRSALQAKADGITAERLRPRVVPTGADAQPDPATASPRTVIRLAPPAGPSESRRRYATGLLAAAAVVALALVVGLTSARHGGSTTPSTLNRGAVSWSQVGPDWTLVQERPKTPSGESGASPEHLLLIDPQQHRFDLATIGSRSWALAAWDRETEYALLSNVAGAATPKLVLQVDLRTGNQTRFTAPAGFDRAQYTGAADRSILLIGVAGMTKVSSTGAVQARFPSSSYYEQGVAISPDRHTIVAGSAHGLTELDAASGRVSGALAAPAGQPVCLRPQWRSDGELTALCRPEGTAQAAVNPFVFTHGGRLGPGHSDAQHPLGFLRVIEFPAGTVAVRQDVEHFPTLAGAQLVAINATGQQRPIPIPVRLRAQGWNVSSSSGNSMLLVHVNDRAGGIHDELVRWNPLSGAVSDVFKADASTGSVLLDVGGSDLEY